MGKVQYSAEEVAALKERADGMLLVAASAQSAVEAATKDAREAQATLLDVARIAVCEIERSCDAIRIYLKAAETLPDLPPAAPIVHEQGETEAARKEE